MEFKFYELRKKVYYISVCKSIKEYYRRLENDLKVLEKNACRSFGAATQDFFHYNLICDNMYFLEIQSFEQFLQKRNNINDESNNIGNSSRGSIRHRSIRNKEHIPLLSTNRKLHKEQSFKFDNSQYIKNIELGEQGELFVISHEKKKLLNYGRADLAEKVIHISKVQGDSIGYDVLSYDINGNEIFVEVKTTSGSISDDFYLTENEYQVMMKRKNYYIYRVHEFNLSINSGQIKKIHCLYEMDNLILDVSMYFVKPNEKLIIK